jgi:hypothetical protein
MCVGVGVGVGLGEGRGGGGGGGEAIKAHATATTQGRAGRANETAPHTVRVTDEGNMGCTSPTRPTNLLLGQVGREPHHIHQVALDDSHVPQGLPVPRRQKGGAMAQVGVRHLGGPVWA